MKNLFRWISNLNPLIQFLIFSCSAVTIYIIVFIVPDYIFQNILLLCLPQDIFIHRERLFSEGDQSNLIQILLLAGTLIAIIEALKTRRESVKQRELEYQPFLALFIRDSNHNGNEGDNNWYYNYVESGENGYFFRVRNTGKGPALNLKITFGANKQNQEEVFEYQSRIVAPIKDEQSFKLTENKEDLEASSLNNMIFIIEANSLTGKTYSYTYKIKDIENQTIDFIEMNPI